MTSVASKPKVLVVDDDQGLLRLIEKSLRRAGCETTGAWSGNDAVNRLRESRCDLMLLDLGLPDMTGRQLVDLLNEQGCRVPFIVITGHGDERVAVEMMKRGAADYLVKDQGFLELVPEVVTKVLHQIESEKRLTATEQALKKEHAFISAVLDTSGSLVVVLDREGHIVRFNRACEKATGYALQEVVGKYAWDVFIVPEELAGIHEIFQKIISGQFSIVHESHWLSKSRDKRLIAWTNTALLDDQGRVEFIIASGTDITERKRLEKEILEISDREQRRIGQDLHDGLCQQLAGTELMSQVLEQRLESKGESEASRVGEIAANVREAIRQTRLLARGLSPITVESDGLMSALEELAVNTERMFGISCEFGCPRPILIRDHAVATHLFRIAQEAVSNAIKHGKSKRVCIRLDEIEGKNVLSVVDYGAGFNFDMMPKNNGMGLQIMKYRAGMIGGTVAITKNDHGGMTVSCTVAQ